MHEEEKVIGPFTLKQFIIAVAGFGSSYLILQEFGMPIALITIPIVIATIVLIIRVQPKEIGMQDFETYLRNKRMQMSRDAYQKWLQRKTAEVASMVEERKIKGFTPDEKLDDSLSKLTAALEINKRGGV